MVYFLQLLQPCSDMTKILLLILLVCLPSLSPLQGYAASFHRPSNEPEKALDRIINYMEVDGAGGGSKLNDLLENRKSSFDFRTLFTAPYIAAVQQAEAALVKQDCGGLYLEGELCGLGYSPVSCAQDTVEYFYHTVALSPHRAIIQADTADPPRDHPIIYTMVKEIFLWKLDGVVCGVGFSFNSDSGK